MNPTQPSQKPSMTPALTAVFTVASGLAVGNLYWVQPLFAQIAADFNIQTTEAGALFTATQVGYALGILLLVPLGDVVHRHKLIAAVMALSALSLAASAAAPSFTLLAFALAAVGATTISGQIILPLAGDLADPRERGKVVGIVSSGIMTGILLSRTVSGLVAQVFGWRAIYVAAAVVNLALMAVIWKAVPSMPKRERVPYPLLIASVFKSLVTVPTLPRILLINGTGFCVFNLFWTSVTFLLAAEPFSFDTFQIGLVSLAGLTGAAASMGMGRFMDQGLSIPATGILLALTLLSMVVALFAGRSLLLVVVSAAIGALASQGVGVLNQARLFNLVPEARSRLNTAFVVNNFISAAIGSALASALWNMGGWTAVCTGGIAVTLLALAVWGASVGAFKRYDDRQHTAMKQLTKEGETCYE